MKLWLMGALIVAVAATALPTVSEAKRLGGGSSQGLQRNMPARTAPEAPAPRPASPAPNQQAAPATPAAVPAAAPRRSWMGPLAGLAAGIGLAALFSHFGLGAGLANLMTMLLLAGAAVFLVMFLLRRFGGGAAKGAPAYAAAGAGAQSPQAWQQPAPMPRSTFEPIEASGPAVTALPQEAMASGAASTPPITRAFVPAGFDAEGFTRTAKLIFIRLQAANDTADLDDLRRFTTPELYASIRLEIQERGATPQQTDVRKVDAEVLDVANEPDRQIVSVRFHGQVVEEKGAAPVDFDEVWHLVKPHDDSRSWAIAGIEQMA